MLNISGQFEVLTSLKPVSYTHLDVYKRQAFSWRLKDIIMLLSFYHLVNGTNFFFLINKLEVIENYVMLLYNFYSNITLWQTGVYSF